MRQLTNAQIDAAIDAAGTRYETCWAYLQAFYGGDFGPDRLDPLLKFQPSLATALFDLSRLHGRVCAEQAARVAAKARSNPAWFRRRMALLATWLERIDAALQVGRGLGDGFAWFFHQNDTGYLRQHSQEPRASTLSTGVGGIGELEFAKNIQILGEFLVVHHCITSMLRLGDASLIDIRTLRVAALAELKSKSEQAGQVTLSLIATFDAETGERLAAQAPALQAPTRAPDFGLTPAAQGRLKRQLARIQTSHVEARKPMDARAAIQIDPRLEVVSEVVRDAQRTGSGVRAVHGGLCLIALRVGGDRLSRTLKASVPRTLHSKALGDALRAVIAPIGIETRDDNALLLGSFYYGANGRASYLPGMTHPIWWPVDRDALRAIAFKQVLVITVYNPAWLFQALEDAGFAVEAEDPRNPTITRQLDDRLFRTENTQYYLRCVCDYLMDEHAIVDMFRAVWDQLPPSGDGRPLHVSVNVEQRFGAPPSGLSAEKTLVGLKSTRTS